MHSSYTDKSVTPQAKLAEIMLERQNKDITLPPHFWNDDKWARPFKTQLRFAIQLLKLYSFEAIQLALSSKQGKNIYSLGAKWLDPLIKQEEHKLQIKNKAQAVLDRVKKEETVQLNLPLESKPLPKQKTLFSKLDEV